MSRRALQKESERIPEVLRALGEPQRIAILRLVQEHELPAGEIAQRFKSTRQAISQHLRVLTSAGLLHERREGTRRLYRVDNQVFGELRAFLDGFWTDRLGAFKRQLEGGKTGKRGS
jgi:DNA-binding transcriptional ArsR family regulator